MLGWHLSAILLVMVLLGGMRSVTGPLLGAAILLGLEEILQGVTEHWKLVEGTMIILIVLARPSLLRRCAELFTAFNVTSPASRQPLKTTSPFGKAGNA
jgi:branched-chain amino acid transport system permease protein